MKRRILTAFALSTLLLVSLSSAALAQDGRQYDRGDVTIVDCSQVQNAVANQGQYADANAAADNGGEAAAEIAQELNISQSQVNACLGGDAGKDPSKDDEETGEETTVNRGTTVIMSPDVQNVGELPKTGGASVGGFVLASGAAVLGAGLLLSRIVR